MQSFHNMERVSNIRDIVTVMVIILPLSSCSSITNIYVSPYEDYPVGEQSLDWKYEAQTVANSLDPDEWDSLDDDSLCSSGSKQSPIDIITDDVVPEDIGSVTGLLFDHDLEGSIVNTGRMVQFVSLGYVRPVITGNLFGDKK